MKNLILTFTLLSSLGLFAQSSSDTTGPSSEKFSLGLTGGATITDIPFTQPFYVDQEPVNTNNEFGYFLGIAARQPLKNRFAAVLEAQYSIKGFRFAASPLENRFHFHYLDFIPQLEYNAYRTLFVSLGGYWGRKLEERFKEGDGNWNTLDNSFFEYAQDNDFGAVAGITLRHKRFSALLRYQHGINLASKGVEFTNDIGETINMSQRNRTLMVGIGFSIL
ncbi:MAG TPA: hypothetical protein DCF33_03135 [Saprospirales bacterium]|nr:hypothetical protein [Saprospirales bacterium]